MMNRQSIRRLLAVGLLTISALIGFASAQPAPAEAHVVTDRYCFAAHRLPALLKARHPASRHGVVATRYEHRTIWGWMARICRDNGAQHNAIHRARCEYLPAAATIRCVWGGGWRGDQAVRVARCESGLRTTATNGQYRGIFQMGSGERARWGHGYTVLAQARAAHRYYRYAGGWGPWACKP